MDVRSLLILLVACGATLGAHAQGTAAAAAAATPATVPSASADPAEPNVRRIVVEDDRARISELRVRGVTKRIVVDPKTGIRRSYEVIPNDPSRDPSPAPDSNRGAAGHRVWNVLDF